MNIVVLVAPMPKGGIDQDNLKHLKESLLPLPDGVLQPEDNVWIVNVEVALDFLLSFPKTAESFNVHNIRGYNTVQKPPSV